MNVKPIYDKKWIFKPRNVTFKINFRCIAHVKGDAYFVFLLFKIHLYSLPKKWRVISGSSI